MTDIRSDEVYASDIVAMAVAPEEEEAEVDEDAVDQTEALRTGEQKREPTVRPAANVGEGEHQMKGSLAEVNPIGPAMATANALRAADVLAHQRGEVVASDRVESVVVPGVNEHTDLAIANDTRVAGGRPVGGAVLNEPDAEGVVQEEAARVKDQLVEQDDLGATIVLEQPGDLEVPPYEDRIPVMEYEDDESVGPRSNADIAADKEEALEKVEDQIDPEPATDEEIEEYDATEVVAATDPEALAEAQAERSEEEAEAQAEEEGIEVVEEDEAEENGEVEQPARSASKGDWVDYVVANFDISREEAEAQTKDDLIDAYGD